MLDNTAQADLKPRPPPLKMLHAFSELPKSIKNLQAQQNQIKVSLKQNEVIPEVVKVPNDLMKMKRALTIVTQRMREDKFKNLVPVRFGQSMYSDESGTPWIKTISPSGKRRAQLAQPKSPYQGLKKLRLNSPTQLIKESLLVHGNLRNGQKPVDFMEALKLFRTRSDSRNSNQYMGFTPLDSREFARRPDDSPLRRQIKFRNSRHGRGDIEDLNSSDFSAVKKLQMEEKHATQLQRQRDLELLGNKKKAILQPTNSEKRAIKRMFNRKNQNQEEIFATLPAVKPNIFIKSFSPQMKDSYLSRLENNKDLQNVTSFGHQSTKKDTNDKNANILPTIECSVQLPTFDSSRRDRIKEEINKQARNFMLKSAFQSQIQTKLKHLSYLPLPDLPKQPTSVTKADSKVQVKPTLSTRPKPARAQSEEIASSKELPPSPFRAPKIKTKKILGSQGSRVSLLSDFELDTGLMLRPGKEANRRILQFAHSAAVELASNVTPLPSLPDRRARKPLDMSDLSELGNPAYASQLEIGSQAPLEVTSTNDNVRKSQVCTKVFIF